MSDSGEEGGLNCSSEGREEGRKGERTKESIKIMSTCKEVGKTGTICPMVVGWRMQRQTLVH